MSAQYPQFPPVTDFDPAATGFQFYDTTLRDGAQREGISYSVNDKLAVARILDDLGVGFIEGGWPGALPKDTEFFARARAELPLHNAVLVAFGATRKAGVDVKEDAQVAALLAAETPAITLVAKSDVRHVTQALKTTYQENLDMVRETVEYLTAQGRRVFVDCEHFFDGHSHDPEYAVAVARTAASAGAEAVVLCDTNGGMLPSGISRVVAAVVDELSPARIGIHCQDDTGCAVANTVAAVESGATHAQVTANGYGERTGNADLFAVAGNLAFKLGIPVLPPEGLANLMWASHALAEIANLPPDTHQPYVGVSAFAHKAGLHASALRVDAELYNHMDPALVGNDMRVLVTEMAGRASVELKAQELGIDLSEEPAVVSDVVEHVKELESEGWTFEAADASFELLVRNALGESVRGFAVESWRAIVEQREDGEVLSEATVKVHAGGERIVATGEGNGPVNALDKALRLALSQIYPELDDITLADYKVRIVEGVRGTDAVTRVLVGSEDGSAYWTTVGVHDNVVAASWMALQDAIDFGLLRRGRLGGSQT
ncbi:MAG: citramalate synthase [Actinobacteria bacterium]|nr:citramalate synthase [Actinomycetota bacterium]